MKRLTELLMCMGGGGSGPAQAIESAPVPTPAPPVTQNNAAVLQAEHDLASHNLLKKSINKTIYAGDTGGYQSSNPQAAGAAAGFKAKLG